MEIIPHFYINLVLSLQNDNDNLPLSDIIEVEHISKWNQIVNILDDERFIEYKQKSTLFNSIETWEGVEFGERFDIINSLLTKQGISDEKEAASFFCDYISAFKTNYNIVEFRRTIVKPYFFTLLKLRIAKNRLFLINFQAKVFFILPKFWLYGVLL